MTQAPSSHPDVNHWHHGMQFLQPGLHDDALLRVPPGALHEDPVHHRSLARPRSAVFTTRLNRNPEEQTTTTHNDQRDDSQEATDTQRDTGIRGTQATYVKSSFCFLVTSQTRHILSRGSSFFLAVLCMMAVRRDWGLKKPANQTQDGSWRKEPS